MGRNDGRCLRLRSGGGRQVKAWHGALVLDVPNACARPLSAVRRHVLHEPCLLISIGITSRVTINCSLRVLRIDVI